MSGGAPLNLGLYGNAALKHLPIPERSRYRPENDEQLLRYHQIPRINTGYESLPITERPAFRYVYCPDCQMTWLVGLEGEESAKNHPFHNTPFHKSIWQSRRSLVVHVHVACSDDGATSGKSSVGIFFGAGSPYNLKYIPATHDSTKQTAEILAATEAVRHVRRYVRPDREEIVRTKNDIHREDSWSGPWSTPRLERHRNNWLFRLIVVTDSKYLVECLCSHRRFWQLKPDSVPRVHNGAPLLNGALFVELLEEIDRLSREGVEVM